MLSGNLLREGADGTPVKGENPPCWNQGRFHLWSLGVASGGSGRAFDAEGKAWRWEGGGQV